MIILFFLQLNFGLSLEFFPLMCKIKFIGPSPFVFPQLVLFDSHFFLGLAV
uniref:Uncharacterized protein n=1 Tax=Rhizophora mucronata TaxID=61149 RepID=A0A2P2QCX0_RHIMU